MKSSVNFIDLTGRVFSELTVLYRDQKSVKTVYWFCQCSCGNIKRVRGGSLKAGVIKSCGCLTHRPAYNFVDITGKTYNYLTVISVAERGKSTKWLVRCRCGTEFIVAGSKIKSGHTKSCGCYRKEVISKLLRKDEGIYAPENKRILQIWKGMKARCFYKKSDNYKYYGGRGITICDEWLNDNNSFYKWAISNGYKYPLTIHRNDNDGNYCPENCCWKTHQEQMQDTSKTIGTALVKIIKKELRDGFTTSFIAKKYNLHYDRICDIKNSVTYSNVKID